MKKINSLAGILCTCLFLLIGGEAWGQTNWVGENVVAGKSYYIYNVAYGYFLNSNNSTTTDISNATFWNLEANGSNFNIKDATTNQYIRIYYTGSWSKKYYAVTNNGSPDPTTLNVKSSNNAEGTKYCLRSVQDNGRYFVCKENGTFEAKWILTGPWGDDCLFLFISQEQLNEVNSRPASCPDLTGATPQAPVDVTSYAIANPNMLWQHWKVNCTQGDAKYVEKDYNSATTTLFENYNQNKTFTGKIYAKTLQEMQPGTYRLTIRAVTNDVNKASAYMYNGVSFNDGKKQLTNNEVIEDVEVWEYIENPSYLEYGIMTEAALSWIAVGNVKLEYVSSSDLVTNYANLKKFRSAYNSLVAITTEHPELTGLVSTITTALNNGTIQNQSAANVTYANAAASDDFGPYNAESLVQAKNSVETLLANARSFIAQLEHIKAYLTQFLSDSQYNTAVAALEVMTTEAEMEAYLETNIRANIKSSYNAGANLTILVLNNSFDMGTIQYWTSEATPAASAEKVGEAPVDGAYLYSGTDALSQTITGLKAGVYQVTAMVAGTDVTLSLNGNACPAFTSTDINTLDAYTGLVKLASAGDLTIALSSANAYKADNIQLVYLGSQVTATISEAGWASACFKYNVTIPQNVTAYKATSLEGGYVHLEVIEGNIPARTGFIYCGAQGEVSFEIAASATPIEDNLFLGTTEATDFTANTIYILSGVNNSKPVFSFFGENAEDAENHTLVAGKAYIPVPQDPEAAPERLEAVIGGNPVATGMINATSKSMSKKVLTNGQLMILREGKMYNVNGMLVK